MSSFRAFSPLTVLTDLRRKSSSESTSTSMNSHVLTLGDAAACSASLPLLTPLCQDDGDWNRPPYNAENAVRPWLCRTDMRRPLPSLMTKFTAHTLRSDTPLPYGPSPFSYASHATHLCPRGNSAIVDDGEEYDLESMDIHIHDTYFATSAERGRWLSSPVAPRVRSQAVPPMRGFSSPIKTPADAPPLGERACRLHSNPFVEERLLTSTSENCDEDVRFSSPLPPSSPITSPISNISFLSDCEGGSIVDPRSNADDCHSLSGTPELSPSSTTCTSPAEPTRTPTPYEASPIVVAHHLTDPPCNPISRPTSPCSLIPVGVGVYASGPTNFEPDDIPSPLSQFELDLPETEPPKLPLSDTVNKPHPGQYSIDPGVNFGATRSQEGTSSIQSISINPNHEFPSISVSSKKVKRRGVPGTRRTKKRADIRPKCSLPDLKETEGRTSSCPEPPRKKSKLLPCEDDAESCKARFLPRCEEISPVNQLPQLHHAVEGCDSMPPRPHDRKTSKPMRRAQPPQPTLSSLTPPILTDPVDAEFHAALTGILIEALATSRATSMDASTLYLVLSQAHPEIMTERSKGELLMDIAAVLEAGRTRCGMFEKVDGSGERSRHRALESRWFYVPERDDDRERASLISALMPRQKRNETKKYKQYYYRPLEKMSRWDPEDAP